VSSSVVALSNPVVPSADHVGAWADRMGSMRFIGDEMDFATMSPTLYVAALASHDDSHGRVEASTWWM
jgi:hypothetical protein